MSRGSEQLNESWLEGVYVFSCCGRRIEPGKRGSLLKQVGHLKRKVRMNGTRTTEVYCMDCRT